MALFYLKSPLPTKLKQSQLSQKALTGWHFSGMLRVQLSNLFNRMRL